MYIESKCVVWILEKLSTIYRRASFIAEQLPANQLSVVLETLTVELNYIVELLWYNKLLIFHGKTEPS